MCNSFEGSSGSFSKENHDLFQNRRRTAEFPVLWNPILKDAIPFLFCKVFGWCAIASPKFSLPLFFFPLTLKIMQIAHYSKERRQQQLTSQVSLFSSSPLFSWRCWARSEEQKGAMSICYASFGQATSVKLFCKMYFRRGHLLLICFLVGSTSQLMWVNQYPCNACVVSCCSREMGILL